MLSYFFLTILFTLFYLSLISSFISSELIEDVSSVFILAFVVTASTERILLLRFLFLRIEELLLLSSLFRVCLLKVAMLVLIFSSLNRTFL